MTEAHHTWADVFFVFAASPIVDLFVGVAVVLGVIGAIACAADWRDRK